MIDINVIIDDRMQSVQNALEKVNLTNLRQIAGRIVNLARRSIRPRVINVSDRRSLSGGKTLFYRSQAGKPPASRFLPGKNIRDAIVSNNPRQIHEVLSARGATHVRDGGSIQVGTLKNEIGDIGEVMEFGGEYKGHHFAPHPFLRPAFDEVVSDISGYWSGSVNAESVGSQTIDYSEYSTTPFASFGE